MKFVYIAFFLFSILLINWFAGMKNTFYFLLLVLASVLVVNAGKYNISVKTPEILN
jgi:uncharacterized membrane protein YphA (DoxX/SURF4 family)